MASFLNVLTLGLAVSLPSASQAPGGKAVPSDATIHTKGSDYESPFLIPKDFREVRSFVSPEGGEWSRKVYAVESPGVFKSVMVPFSTFTDKGQQTRLIATPRPSPLPQDYPTMTFAPLPWWNSAEKARIHSISTPEALAPTNFPGRPNLDEPQFPRPLW